MSKNYSFSDGIATFIILLIGAAEAAHLCGIFLHRPFSECAILFGIFAVGALIVLIAAVIWCRKAGHAVCTGNGWSRAEKVLLTVFILLAVVQVLYAASQRWQSVFPRRIKTAFLRRCTVMPTWH